MLYKEWDGNYFIYPDEKFFANSFLGKSNLEINPGLKPRIKIDNTFFIDLSEKSLKEIKKRNGKVILSNYKEILPFKNESFDFIACFEVMENIENDGAFLKEVNRILKNNGVFVTAVACNKKLLSKADTLVSHIRRYDNEELVSKLENEGFEIEKSHYAKTKIYFIKQLLVRTLFPQKFLHSLIFPVLENSYNKKHRKIKWNNEFSEDYYRIIAVGRKK